MPTYAHICPSTGQALDPHVRDNIESYFKLFHAPLTSGWNVIQVPDRSQHNDTLILTDGVYTNPTLVAREEAEALRLAEEAARAAELEQGE